MDQSSGGFGAPAGGISPALQAAIQRRPAAPNAGNPLNQVTQGAPTFDPNTQVPTSPQMPPATPPPGMQTQTPLSTSMIDPGETKIILQALKSRMDAISRIQGGH